MRILIWGTGENAEKYLKTKETDQADLVGFIESQPSKGETRCKLEKGGGNVFAPDEVKELDYDFILVCVWPEQFINEIAETCMQTGILDSRVVFMRNIRGMTLQRDRFIYYNKYQNDTEIKKCFPVFWSQFMEHGKPDTDRVLTARTNEDVLQDSLIYTKEFKDYTNDYFRYRTFEFVAQEIKNRNAKGAVAEAGVSVGTFSRLINRVFHDRTLYMFDTFDSFDRQEFEEDISSASSREEFYEMYRGIDVEAVLESMPCRENCKIRKGLFPDTTAGLEKMAYAFVSIDMDLEKSIYHGLTYFYPRLSPGGAIFLHDYRCYDLQGVRKAVERFEEEYGRLYKVPIADRGGTLVIVK